MSKKLFARLILALGVAELVLVLLSWVLSVVTTMEVHSLLSSEGVRWFFGSFTDFLATQYLVWLLLIAMAGGCFWKSRRAFSLAVMPIGTRTISTVEGHVFAS